MSIQKVGSNDPMTDFRNKIAGVAATGAVAGGVYSATKKNWIYKGLPSDTFVKNVSQNLRKNMSSEELMESAKVSKFLADVINPETNIDDLKPQIRDSKELSNAIKLSSDEDVEQAINRVYSQPKDKVKSDLSALQFKTTADKKANRNTALKLINENFDASQKKLVKSESTAEGVFNMIKSTAHKIQAKAIAKSAVLSGIFVGAMALIMTNVPDEKNV